MLALVSTIFFQEPWPNREADDDNFYADDNAIIYQF
jgi:hypothetical protein